MSKLRCVLAAVFTILIVAPVCCCLAAAHPAEEAAHVCCHEAPACPADSTCDCESQATVITETHHPIPAALVFAIPAITIAPAPVITAMEAKGFEPCVFHIDTGPPGRRLALLQRYLI